MIWRRLLGQDTIEIQTSKGKWVPLRGDDDPVYEVENESSEWRNEWQH